MYYIPDNYSSWSTYDSQKEREWEETRSRLPVCEVCGGTIDDEYAICLDDDYWYHEDCFRDNYRKAVPFD